MTERPSTARRERPPDDNPSSQDEHQGARAQQKAETRARILQCALEEFAAKGFDGASIRDIGSAAGVRHGLIRHHFEDKEGLWRSAVDFLFERLRVEMGDFEEGGDLPLEQRAENWIRRYVRYCARHPEHARIMVQASVTDSDRLSWAAEKHIRPDHMRGRARLEEQIANGVFPDMPLPSLAYSIVAMAQTPFMLGPELQKVYGV
ncbi:MAG: TetR/AcrR family transcriptional regulator, partial [Parvularcula sp.]|nr:TetR/AcrR family transcriptional regulator [Parvularcula sp.]